MHETNDEHGEQRDEEGVASGAPGGQEPERRPGPEGGHESPDAHKAPGTPTDSDAELGDTDQHSHA